jgi:hypothetical protein
MKDQQITETEASGGAGPPNSSDRMVDVIANVVPGPHGHWSNYQSKKLLICPAKIVVMIQIKAVLDDNFICFDCLAFIWDNTIIHIVIVHIVKQK